MHIRNTVSLVLVGVILVGVIMGVSSVYANRMVEPAGVFGRPVWSIRTTFAVGGGGADDVTVASSIPYAVRVVRVTIIISTGIAAGTVTLRDTAGGAGTALSQGLSVAVGGRAVDASTTTSTLASGGSLFLRRSNNLCAGEAIVEVSPE